MGVDKVILRAFLSTLAAIAILFAFMFTTLVAVYPQTMMEITYDLGMETPSIWFAEEAYKRTDDVGYIAHATEVAISEEKYETVQKCGEKLIADDTFVGYCVEKTEAMGDKVSSGYDQYVYGQVCVATYKLGKKDDAVARAFELTGEAFPKNNAVVALIVTANKAGDTATLETIKGKMEQLNERLPEGADKAYLGEVLALVVKG